MSMLAIVPIDTLIFIALAIIAGFFRWISKEAEKAKRKDQSRPPKPTSLQRKGESDTERVRRFLEALGQPQTNPPPSPIQRKVVSPPEKRVIVARDRKIFTPLPPLTTVPPAMPIETPATLSPPKDAQALPSIPVTVEPPKTATSLPIAFPETVHETAAYTDVMKLLSSGSGLRDAIVLREILGLPRSLQTFDF